MLHGSLINLASLTPDLHFRIVDALFGLVLIAIPNAKATLSVIIRINLASLTGLTSGPISYIVPLTLLSIPQ